MPTTLTEDRHLEVLAAAGAGLAGHVEAAGLATPVPTCPDWSVADLVAHLGHVHRWAAANLRGEDLARFEGPSTAEAGRPDLLEWFGEGLDDLLAAFAGAPPDVQAMRFLRDAPAARAFWARRQAHETTMHGVDALAARLGRMPSAGEADVDTDVAVDGIDELLCGFLPRNSSRLRSDSPLSLVVAPDDSERTWLVAISAEPPVATPDVGATAADVTLSGSAAQLYLWMWNRALEVDARVEASPAGGTDVVARWRELQRVQWT